MLKKNIATFEQQREVIERGMKARYDAAIERGEANAERFLLVEGELEKLGSLYASHLENINAYVPKEHEGRDIVVNVPVLYDDPYVYAGGQRTSQIIANGDVSDKSVSQRNEWNFHGSNTSQWIFGFGLVFDVRDHTFRMHT